MMIDAILIEGLKSEFNESPYGFYEVNSDWEGTGLGYTGDVDYMFRSYRTKSVDTTDSCLLVVEAKYERPAKSVAPTLAEAGCLLKKRLDAGKPPLPVVLLVHLMVVLKMVVLVQLD